MEDYRASAAVFEGVVERIEPQQDQRRSATVVLRVVRVWKGELEIDRPVSVRWEGAKCTLTMCWLVPSPQQRVLLFVRQEGDELVLRVCTHSRRSNRRTGEWMESVVAAASG